MEDKQLPVLSKKRIEGIAWKILTEQGLKTPPAEIMRDIGNQSKKSGISEEELKEFAKALINDEYATTLNSSLSENRRNEIALILVKCKYDSHAQKIGPEEAKKARGVLAKKIGVTAITLEAFSAQIMTELYEKAFREKK